MVGGKGEPGVRHAIVLLCVPARSVSPFFFSHFLAQRGEGNNFAALAVVVVATAIAAAAIAIAATIK